MYDTVSGTHSNGNKWTRHDLRLSNSNEETVIVKLWNIATAKDIDGDLVRMSHLEPEMFNTKLNLNSTLETTIEVIVMVILYVFIRQMKRIINLYQWNITNYRCPHYSQE